MKKNIIFFLFSFSSYCFACDCPNDLPPVTKETGNMYDIIFYGTVDSVSPCTTKGIAKAYFSIIELYKGKATKQLEINFDCSTACMMSFAKGEEWIIYSTFKHFNLLGVNFCEHSRKHLIESKDYNTINSQRSFEDERKILNTTFGIQKYIIENNLNADQKELNGRNEQPSNRNKIGLLVISFIAMAIVYYVTRIRKK